MDNYKDIKNYMHNELKITKEDIDKLIINEVEKQVKKQINSLFKDTEFRKEFIESYIKKIFKEEEYHNPENYKLITDINRYLYEEIIEEIGKKVHDNIKIKIELKKDELEIENIKEEK